MTEYLSAPALSWLGRATYGVSRHLIDEFYSSGSADAQRWKAYVRNQLQRDDHVDASCENKILADGGAILRQEPHAIWQDYQGEKGKEAQIPALAVEKASWYRSVYSRYQIYERMVEFWHDHFHIYGYDRRTSPSMIAFNRDVIRCHALGNFGELLGAVAQSPAMLYYLDNASNRSGNPNENFARELFELHTLGAENYFGTGGRESVPRDKKGKPLGYVDGDIYEAARALSGWRVADGEGTGKSNQKVPDTGDFLYYEPWHDRFQKVVLGVSLPEHQGPMQDGRTILTLLADHLGTARFLVHKLCRRFLMDDPPKELVEKLTKSFHERRTSPTQIRDTLEDLLMSDAYQRAGQSKFKRPIEFVTSIIRGLGMDFQPSQRLVDVVAQSGQRFFAWRTPDGAPDVAAPWQSAQSLLGRWRLAQQMLAGRIPGCRWTEQEGLASAAGNSWEAAETVIKTMLGGTVSPQLLQEAGRVMESKGISKKPRGEQLQILMSLVFLSPEFQWR